MIKFFPTTRYTRSVMATRGTPALTDGSVSGTDRPNPMLTLNASSEFWSKRDVATTPQLGDTLCDRAEKIYHQTTALRTFVQNTASNPMRAGCSILTLLTGLTSLWAGDLVTGAIATTCGAKELWNLSSPEASTNLQRLLNDINADVGMIQTLEEANRKSYETVNSNLELISQGVQTLQSQLSDISSINSNGLQQVEAKKEEAISFNSQATSTYAAASELFAAAKQKLSQAQSFYGECGEVFEEIEKIAKNDDPDMTLEEKIERLIKTSRTASENCKSGKAMLVASSEDLEHAMELLKQANTLKDQATAAYASANQMAEDTLHAGIEKAKYTGECQEKIKATQDEMARIQRRSDQIMKLIDELKADVVEAKREAAGKFSMGDVAVGIGVAAVVVPPAGIIYGAATAVSAMYAFRNSETISWAASKVYSWAMGIPTPVPNPMKDDELTRISFKESSSGYWGYFVQRRASTTVGTLQVNLGGGEEFALPFNLNDKDKIAKEGLLNLFQVLNQKVTQGQMTPQKCLQILNQLETMNIERGALHPQVHGLIKQTSPTYAIVTLLRETCEKRVELLQVS